MNVNSILNQFLGTLQSAQTTSTSGGSSKDWTGIASGAAAGGLMGLLMGSKHTRKALGSAATYGGIAVLGGLAYKAFQNWQQKQVPTQLSGSTDTTPVIAPPEFGVPTSESSSSTPSLEVALVKTMIAAAKVDGEIDSVEQKRIFEFIQNSQMTSAQKAIVLDSFGSNVAVDELARLVKTIEHRAEVYLAAYLVSNPVNDAAQTFLRSLSSALELPTDLVKQLELQGGKNSQQGK